MLYIQDYILFAESDSGEVMAGIALFCLCFAALGLLLGLVNLNNLSKQKKSRENKLEICLQGWSE